MRDVQQQGSLTYIVAESPAAVPRPVLMFLHGYDEAAPTPMEEGLTRHGPLRPGNTLRPTDEFLVVAPQLPRRGDVWRLHAGEVASILERIHVDRGGDPARSYLTGFSFGGNGVFDLALLQPRTWAALWAVDPTRVPAGDPQRPVWLSFGEVARTARPRFVRTLSLRPPGHGGSHGARVYLDEGADHVGSAALAYDDQRIYAWLLTQRLETA